MLAEILEARLHAVAQLVARHAGDADAAGLRQRLHARGDVHAVAEHVAVPHHHVADIEADAQLHALVLRQGGIRLGERLLDCDGA